MILHAKSRIAFYASVFLICIILKLFKNVDNNLIISIVIIAAFLMLFNYIFRSEGPNFLKISIIVFSFIGLPLFLLFYLGIFNSISNPLGRIALVIFVMLLGVIAVITIFKLNYVEIAYDRIDEK